MVFLAGLAVTLSVTACGDAESAQDEASVRMIPPAEAAADAEGAGAPVAEPEIRGAVEEEGDAEAPPGPAEDAATTASREEGQGDAATRPRAVRRAPAEPEGRAAAPAADGVRDTQGNAPIDRPPREGALERTDPGPLSPPEAFERATEVVTAPPTVPAGTRVELIVEEELSTGETREGDRFRARLEDDVLDGEGMVLLPRDAAVRGRVVESRKSDGPDRPAVLGLVVESVRVDGVSYPVRGTVEEVEMDAAARDGTGETAAKVGVGVAAGAILGKILGGDSKDALKGAAVGAAAGAAVALATRDGHATIPRGARLVVRLDEPLVLARTGGSERWRP